MQGKTPYFLRFITPLAVIFSCALAFVPLMLIAPRFVLARPALIGPKAAYLALGDSLAFGFQPDFDWANGYANYFYTDLKKHGVKDYNNLACAGETSTSMISGGCPYAFLRKYLYTGPQLQAALNYLHKHAGQVSPVTLDIGANDLIPDLNTSNCSINAKWESDLARVDHNLTGVILPQLVAALTINGQVSGDLLLLNYFDPFQSICPNTARYIQEINHHLATDAHGYATVIDVFSSFSGPATVAGPVSDPVSPVSTVCLYTWMCSRFKDIHANDAGYNIMAGAIEHAANY